MQPRAFPYFATGDLLSAAGVNALAEVINDIRGAALGPAMAQEELGFNNSTYRYSAPHYLRSRRGHVVHRHDATYYDCEWLFYDITLERSDAGQGGAMFCEIWYKSTLLTTLTLAEGDDSERFTDLVTLYEFPTAETHPADAEAVPVSVRAKTTTANPWLIVTVHRLEEVIIPDSDVWTAMNDANALVDGTLSAADVATDLQHVADNASTLVDIMRQSATGFWQVELNVGDEIPRRADTEGAYSEAAAWYWHTTRADRLYYKLLMWMDNEGYEGSAIQVKFQIDGEDVGSVIQLTYNAFGVANMVAFEGSIDISGVARNRQQFSKIGLLARSVNPGGTGFGFGAVHVEYLYEGI